MPSNNSGTNSGTDPRDRDQRDRPGEPASEAARDVGRNPHALEREGAGSRRDGKEGGGRGGNSRSGGNDRGTSGGDRSSKW